jgi:hypothetical protein
MCTAALVKPVLTLHKPFCRFLLGAIEVVAAASASSEPSDPPSAAGQGEEAGAAETCGDPTRKTGQAAAFFQLTEVLPFCSTGCSGCFWIGVKHMAN